MSIAHTTELRAKEGLANTLLNRLEALASQIIPLAGCLKCRVLKSQVDPNVVVLFDVWESKEARLNSDITIPSDTLEEANLLAEQPNSRYFTVKGDW